MDTSCGLPVQHPDDIDVTTTTANLAEAVAATPAGGGGGYTLQSRPANVTLGRKESLTKKGAEGDNDLKETRDFYGIGPSASTAVPPNSNSASLRGRNRSNSRVSRFSVKSARPMSPLSQTSSSANPSARQGAILPTPKGFYSPQKPAAAMRLEQLERKRQAHAQGQASDTIEEGPSIATTPGDSADRRGSVQSLDPPFHLSDSQARYPPHAGASLTEVGSHPDPEPSSESSDDLVHRQADEKDEKTKPGLPLHRTRPTGPARVRRYKNFDNPLTKFGLNGHIMTGGSDWYSAIIAMGLLLGMSGLWVGTTGAWMWRNGSEYGLANGGGVAVTIIFVYLFGLTFSSFIASSLRDPGLLPRLLDENPPTVRGETDSLEWPLDRSIAINDGSVTVRWCETCRTYRPPRSSHCRMCDNCVDGIDHHCAYIHTCVGRRNYLSFLTLLITATIAAIYIVVFSAIHFMLICRHEDVAFGTALRASPGAAVSFLLGVFLLPAMLFLLAYHIRLMIFNLTTVEQIRESASKNLIKATRRPANNPFSADSLWRNLLLASLGRPQFPSWIDASGWDEVDRRKANPGVVSQSGLAPPG